LLLLGLAQQAGASSAAAETFVRASESLTNGLGPLHPLTLEARAAS
jgi:hypothetical protein